MGTLRVKGSNVWEESSPFLAFRHVLKLQKMVGWSGLFLLLDWELGAGRLLFCLPL